MTGTGSGNNEQDYIGLELSCAGVCKALEHR